MSIKGFRDKDGIPVPFSEIDHVRDAWRFNCSPATLKMLMDSVRTRDGVDFSASMVGMPARQHLLKSRDYYPPTSHLIKQWRGTLQHQQVNVNGDRLLVEHRFTSRRNPRLSAQIDSAALVVIDGEGTGWVDLYDLKNVAWYSVTLIVKDVWKNHPDYAWQLNLGATLLEESFTDDHRDYATKLALISAGWPLAAAGVVPNNQRITRLKVRGMYLECIPADGTYKHEAEAERLGIPEYQKVIVPVSRKSADEVYEVYERAMEMRDEVIASGRAPLCPDRWSNKTVSDLRCRAYCEVKAECIAHQHNNGEPHPVAPLDSALAASLKVAVNE